MESLIVLIAFAALVVGFIIGRASASGHAATPPEQGSGPTAASASHMVPQTVADHASRLTDNQKAEITNLLYADKTISAIKLFRDHTGSDLRTAKQAIDEIKRQLGL